MKRVISCILVGLLAFSLSACFMPDLSPEATPDPTEVPATPPVFTEEPNVVTGLKDYFAVVPKGESLSVDIDFDGELDTVYLIDREEDGAMMTVIEVKLNNGQKAISIMEQQDVNLIIVDCDDTDSSLDVIACWCMDGSDWFAKGLRCVEGPLGTSFKNYSGDLGFSLPADYEYHSEEGFPVFVRADALGTYMMNAYYTLGENTFECVGDVYYYPAGDDPETAPQLFLVRELEVEILDTHESYTVPSGTTIYPFSTDLKTYVIVKLEDGRMGVAGLSPATGDGDWGYYVNGIHQDEYGQIPYSD